MRAAKMLLSQFGFGFFSSFFPRAERVSVRICSWRRGNGSPFVSSEFSYPFREGALEKSVYCWVCVCVVLEVKAKESCNELFGYYFCQNCERFFSLIYYSVLLLHIYYYMFYSCFLLFLLSCFFIFEIFFNVS